MFRRRTKPINKKLLFIRIYVSVMTLMLATALVALLSQSATARAYMASERDRAAADTAIGTDPGQDQTGTYPYALDDSQTITVYYHGQTMKTSGNGETAGELLRRLGLDVSGEDMVSHGLEEKTYDGMELYIDQVKTRQETYAVTIPHEIQRCGDSTLPEGTEQILLEGEDGELLCTAEVTYTNGIESSRRVLSQTVSRQPVTEIVGVGTGEPPAQTDPEAMPQIGDGYIRLATGEVLTYTDTATVRATAYTQTDAGCDGITATGTNVRRGAVAVDPRYIPYGTRMFIVTASGSYVYGIAMAEDCGGDIKGDRIDLYFPTYEECREFGRRVCTVYFLG